MKAALAKAEWKDLKETWGKTWEERRREGERLDFNTQGYRFWAEAYSYNLSLLKYNNNKQQHTPIYAKYSGKAKRERERLNFNTQGYRF